MSHYQTKSLIEKKANRLTGISNENLDKQFNWYIDQQIKNKERDRGTDHKLKVG